MSATVPIKWFLPLLCSIVLLFTGCGSGGDSGPTVVSAGTPSGSTGCPTADAGPSAKAVCVASIEWGPEGRALSIGQSVFYSATAFDAARSPITTEVLTFSSSQPGVAAVSNPTARGVTVTALANGVATLTASLGGKSSSITVTVGIGSDTQVTGRVVDAKTQQGIGGAQLEFRPSDANAASGVFTVTAADGSYSFALRGSAQGVLVTVNKSGYVGTTLSQSVVRPNTALAPLVLVPLLANGALPVSTLGGTVRNARDRTVIANAQVALHAGQGVSASSIPPTRTTSDAGGRFSFASVAGGTYTLVADAPGFANCQRVAVLIGATVPEPDQDLFCSPVNDNAIRIVLTWGDNPRDLDSHLTGSNDNGSRFHVYFPSGSRGYDRADTPAAPWARLDTDQTTGRGPETITLNRLNTGVYRYSVHDFSNKGNAASTALSASGAKVELYLPGGGSETFFVPGGAGTLWTVFELSGDLASPTLTRRNTLSAAEDPASIP